MTYGFFRGGARSLALAGIGYLLLCASVADAADISPHRALYTMTLASARTDSGVASARGTMVYQWGETCDGWTVEQRYRLTMSYTESADVEILSNFVTWEAKNGLRYRFNQRETRNGKVDQEIHGEATLDGPGRGGVAAFEKPKPETLKLPPGTLFPSAHTIQLIDHGMAGDNFVTRQLFDGATEETAVLVSAVIGPKVGPDPAADKVSPLLVRPGWRTRLAFFPADQNIEKPDYELGMLLLDNGVSRDMIIDYGEYAIKATLDSIEILPKPHC
jgi:hypothetical protein